MSYYSEKEDLSFKLPSAEEERQMFETFYSGGPGAQEARNTIIRNHLGFVVRLAHEIDRTQKFITEEEAVSAGNLGLMTALDRKNFDPNRGSRFCHYVCHYIRGAIFKEIDKAVKQTFHRKVSDVAHFGAGAAATGWVGRMLSSEDDENVLEMPYPGAIREELGSEEPITHDHAAESNDCTKVLERALRRIPSREARMLRLVYLHGMSRAAAGRKLKPPINSREVARRFHDQALVNLRRKLGDKVARELLGDAEQ